MTNLTFKLGASSFIGHNDIITLPDKVLMTFIPTAYSIGDLTLCIASGGVTRKYRIDPESAIDVSEAFAIPGEVAASVILTVRGEKAKGWSIEPFCVREIEGAVESVPKITALEERIRVLEQAVAEMAALIDN